MISQKKATASISRNFAKNFEQYFLKSLLILQISPFWLQLTFGSINQSHSYLLNLARATYD